MDEKDFKEAYGMVDQLFLQVSAAHNSRDSDAFGLPAAPPVTADDYISKYKEGILQVYSVNFPLLFHFIGKFYDLPYEIKTLRGLCTDA